MNKLLVALGLAATVALVGCNKDKAPETGATTGEHLENAAQQASADIKSAGDKAADDIATATDNAAEKIDAATDHAADATAKAAAETEATARKATADTAQAVENTAAEVKKRRSTLIVFSIKKPLLIRGFFLALKIFYEIKPSSRIAICTD